MFRQLRAVLRSCLVKKTKLDDAIHVWRCLSDQNDAAAKTLGASGAAPEVVAVFEAAATEAVTVAVKLAQLAARQRHDAR